jgi:hypothetical protein
MVLRVEISKKTDTDEVYLYEKHPSNLQGTVNHNSEQDRAFAPTMCWVWQSLEAEIETHSRDMDMHVVW